MRVETNADGTATATVGNKRQTFPNFNAAIEWATALLYETEGEDSG
jgi:hypothetical protein